MELENLAGYTGRPCAYVRWLDEQKAFYIGKANNLLKRYADPELAQIIYFEEYETEAEALVAEQRLMCEFQEDVSWPLLNKYTPNDYSDTYWQRREAEIYVQPLLEVSEEEICRKILALFDGSPDEWGEPVQKLDPSFVCQSIDVHYLTVLRLMRSMAKNKKLLIDERGRFSLA